MLKDTARSNSWFGNIFSKGKGRSKGGAQSERPQVQGNLGEQAISPDEKAKYKIEVTIQWKDSQNGHQEWHYIANLNSLDAAKASRLAWSAFRQERKARKDWGEVLNPQISCKEA